MTARELIAQLVNGAVARLPKVREEIEWRRLNIENGTGNEWVSDERKRFHIDRAKGLLATARVLRIKCSAKVALP